jgi:WD40 repeat protein
MELIETRETIVEKVKESEEFLQTYVCLDSEFDRKAREALIEAKALIATDDQAAHKKSISLLKDLGILSKGYILVEDFEGKNLEKFVTSVAFSPDGRFIVAAALSGDIYLLNAHTGKPLPDFKVKHDSLVNDITFSPDSRYIISAGHDGVIWLWDVSTKKPVAGSEALKARELMSRVASDAMLLSRSSYFAKLKESVGGVAFNPNGRFIVAGCWDKILRLWEMPSGNPVTSFDGKGHTEGVSSVAFSLNRRFIASGGYDKTVRLWDADTGKPILSFNGKGHTGSVVGVAFSPDSRFIVSAGGVDDKTIRLWDVPNGNPVSGFDGIGHTERVDDVAFSSDGRLIVSCGHDKTVRLWDANTGKPVLDFNGNVHTDEVHSVAFSPNDRFIVSASKDKTLRLWSRNWITKDKPKQVETEKTAKTCFVATAVYDSP